MNSRSFPTRLAETGWIDFPRPKTTVDRRVPLWTETLDTLREIVETPQQKPEDIADLMLVTKYGNRWERTNNAGRPILTRVLHVVRTGSN